MKPALIIIFLILAVVVGVLIVKYVFSTFPGLQQGASSAGDAGIFKSVDQGENWVQLAAKREKDKTKIKISDLNIYDIEVNPQDSQVVFAGSQGRGFLKSFDGGNSWQALPKDSLGAASSVLSIAIDPKNPKNIYLASYFGGRGRILKTEDMGESFKEVFVVNADKIQVSQLEVDNYDSSVIFASTSDGLFLQSRDSGISWQTINNFEEPIQKFVINPKDTREIYVSLAKKGVLRTLDKGLTWEDLTPNLEKLYPKSGLGAIQEISIDPSLPNIIYIGSRAKLLKSIDHGGSFEEIKSLVAGKDYQISIISVDYSDSSRIYINGGSQIYKSIDGGNHWIVKSLNTKKNITVFKIDPNNPLTLYAGLGNK